MLRTICPQHRHRTLSCFPGALRLPPVLDELDRLFDHHRLFVPIRPHFHLTHGARRADRDLPANESVVGETLATPILTDVGGSHFLPNLGEMLVQDRQDGVR